MRDVHGQHECRGRMDAWERRYFCTVDDKRVTETNLSAALVLVFKAVPVLAPAPPARVRAVIAPLKPPGFRVSPDVWRRGLPVIFGWKHAYKFV